MTTSTSSTTPNPTSLSNTIQSITGISNFVAKSYKGELRVVMNGDLFHMVGINSHDQIMASASSSIVPFAKNGVGNASKLQWPNPTILADSGDSDAPNFKSQKRLGVAVVDGTTWIFWIDTKDSNLYATRYANGTSGSTSEWVLVQTADSSRTNFAAINISSGGICATSGVEPGQIILSYLAKGSNQTLDTVQLTLDIANYSEAQNTWIVAGMPWTLPTTVNAPSGSTTPGNYDIRCITAAIPGVDAATGLNTITKFMFGAIWQWPGSGAGTLTTMCWQLQSDGTPLTNPTAIPLRWPGSQPAANRKGDGLALTIDPAGRLLGVFGDGNRSGDIHFAQISDFTELLAYSTASPGSTTAPVWTEFTPAFSSDCSDDDEDAEGPVSVQFCLSSHCLKPLSNPPQYPIVMAMFWIRTSATSDECAQLGTMPYAHVQITEAVAEPPGDLATQRIVTTVCDPFPMPQPSPTLWDNSTPDGMADWLLFEYALLSGHTHTRVEDMSWKLGMAVAYDHIQQNSSGFIGGVRLGGGVNWTQSNSLSTYTAQGLKVQTKACFHPLATPGSAEAPYALRPYGIYAARSMLSVRRVTYAIVKLALKNDSDECSFDNYQAIESTRNNDPITGDFFSYAVTPGDIMSYTEANINNRMRYLYTRLQEKYGVDTVIGWFTDKDKDGNTIDLTHYYTSGNYVRDVIRDYGEVLAPQASGSKARYVSFALSGSSVSDGSFVVRAGKANGFGGYLNLDAYAGYYSTWGIPNVFDNLFSTTTVGTDSATSTAEEADAIGDLDATPAANTEAPPDSSLPIDEDDPSPEEQSTQPHTRDDQIKLELEFEFTRMVTDSDEDTTAISMNTYYNPLSPTQSLSARLYGFRPAKLWALELEHFPALAREDYMAGLQAQANALHAQTPSVETPDFENDPDLAMTISNQSSLGVDQSRPARYMLLVSNWDSGGYPINPNYRISTYYKESVDLTPASIHNTGTGTGTSDPNYLYNGQPAPLVASPPGGWVAAPTGSRWISIAQNGQGDSGITYAYATQVNLGAFSPNAVTIQGQCAADDSCTILVNNVTVTDPWGTGNATGAAYAHLTSFSIPGSYFQTGANTVTFQVHNTGGGPTGLLITHFEISPIA